MCESRASARSTPDRSTCVIAAVPDPIAAITKPRAHKPATIIDVPDTVIGRLPITTLGPGDVMVMTGGVRSDVTVTVALDVWPAWSVASTTSAAAPSISRPTVYAKAPFVTGTSTKLTRTITGESSATLPVTSTSPTLVMRPSAGDVIVTCGAIESTLTVTCAVAVLPA